MQEEPKNMGAYSYVFPRFQTAGEKVGVNSTSLRYVGRFASAAPATGKAKNHQLEQHIIINDALT